MYQMPTLVLHFCTSELIIREGVEGMGGSQQQQQQQPTSLCPRAGTPVSSHSEARKSCES